PKEKVKATAEERNKAKEKVKEKLGKEALSSLANLQNSLPNMKLQVATSALGTGGAKAASAGSIVDKNAVIALSGINEDELALIQSGEVLADREITSVAVSDEDVAAVREAQAQESSGKRSQEEMRIVFEVNKQKFFSAYRRAQQKDPTLQGTVVLAIEIQPNGSVSSCEISRSELNNAGLERRLLSTCKRMSFKSRDGVDVAKVEFPINFLP
ncbi:MAG: TonB family protein, partial [Oceanobacter sp.]